MVFGTKKPIFGNISLELTSGVGVIDDPLQPAHQKSGVILIFKPCPFPISNITISMPKKTSSLVLKKKLSTAIADGGRREIVRGK